MKTAIFTLLLFSIAFAGNPDEKPSIEIWMMGSMLKGDNNIVDDYGISIGQEGEQKSFGIGFQVISPASENISIIAGLNYLKSTAELEPTSFLYEQDRKYSGILGSIGIKIYFDTKKK